MDTAFAFTLSTPGLLAVAAGAIAVLLFLIIKVKLHPFLALVIVSIATALATGVTVDDLLPTLLSGFGKTLGNVALLIGFGAILGRIVAISGGAKVLADTLIRICGKQKAPLGLSIASLLFGFPIFLDAAFVVMLPVIYSIARELRGSLLIYALPAAGAFLVMHALVPPHPGPVAAAVFLEGDIGMVLLVALIVGLPTWYLAGYQLSLWLAKRTPFHPVPDLMGGADSDEVERTSLPRFSTILLVLLLPLVLIFMNTGITTLISAGTLPEGNPVLGTLTLIGETPVALLISLCLAMWLLLLRGHDKGAMGAVNETIEKALAPVCSIILITGAGGMFGGVLTASGIGEALADSLQSLGLPILVAGYVIAAVIRIAQGSATVAGTTAAGILAPAVLDSSLSGMPLACVVVAVVAGAIGYSHVNDSGFWLVGRFLGMETKTMLKTWSVVSTAISLMAFGLAWALFAMLT